MTSADLTTEGLVHDLNNVFTTMLDVAELLETDPEWSAMAAILQRNVARGRRILEGFFETGGGVLELDQALDDVIEFVSDWLQLQGRDVSFRRAVAGGLRLRGSAIAWERALSNLLFNAAQAMEDGGVVEICARQAEGTVELTVRDSGPGIAPDVLPRIFEPGFSTKRRSGLGLHIVQSIVQRAGGTITAANREDRGAEFRITAPSAGATGPCGG